MPIPYLITLSRASITSSLSVRTWIAGALGRSEACSPSHCIRWKESRSETPSGSVFRRLLSHYNISPSGLREVQVVDARSSQASFGERRLHVICRVAPLRDLQHSLVFRKIFLNTCTTPCEELKASSKIVCRLSSHKR